MRHHPRHRSLRLAALAALLSLSLFAAEAGACPNCRDALPNGTQADGAAGPTVAQGFAWSIYLMIAMPFTLAGTFAVTAVVLARKASARQARRSAL